MGKPDACTMSTYQRHENIFGKNGSCMKKGDKANKRWMRVR